MTVGIKYCGGCNPRYDRAAYVKKTCDAHPEWQWEYAKEGAGYDLLLVIGGCTNCCADVSAYEAKEIVRIRTGEETV